MSFRLVPKSVTLNDLERHNDRYLGFFAEFGSFRGLLRQKWSKIDLYSLRQKCSPKNVVFGYIWLMAIFAEVTENECIIERHLRIIDASLACDGAFSTSESHFMLSIEMGLPYGFSLTVRPSICLSHSWSTPKRFNMLKCLLHITMERC